MSRLDLYTFTSHSWKLIDSKQSHKDTSNKQSHLNISSDQLIALNY